MMAVTAEPIRETAKRALIEAHIAEGNWVEGRRSFEFYRNLLDRELGVQPDPELASIVYGPGWPSEFAALAASGPVERHHHSGSVGKRNGLGDHRNKAPSWNGSNGYAPFAAHIGVVAAPLYEGPNGTGSGPVSWIWLSGKE